MFLPLFNGNYANLQHIENELSLSLFLPLSRIPFGMRVDAKMQIRFYVDDTNAIETGAESESIRQNRI